MSRLGPVSVMVDADVLGRQRTGDETYIRQLLLELGQLDTGLEIVAVTRKAAEVPGDLQAVRLAVFSQIARIGYQLPVLLARYKPRVAHFQYVIPPAYKGPAVLSVHDISYDLLPQFENRLDGIALRRLVPRSIERAARVLTGSEWTKRDLVARYGIEPGHVEVTPYGVDPVFSPDGERPEGPPYILFVGAMRPRKDPVSVLHSLEQLPVEMRVVMAGPAGPELPKVREVIERYGLQHRVEVVGHVGLKRLASLYRGAQCFVLPSYYEGFGLPVIEAMASGVPVVTTTAGALGEVAGDAAVLVEPGDSNALAQGVLAALERRQELIEAGIERARQYSWRETALKTMKVYKEIIAA